MKTLVVTPTYGRLPYLGKVLASFLSQTYDDKEMVIINDDNRVTLKCDFPNVHVINLNKKILLPQKRNLANTIGYHDLILPLDDDDVFLPNRISNNVEIFKNHPDIDVYKNKITYQTLEYKFTIGDAGFNIIAYRKSAWFKIGGYTHDKNLAEDIEFYNKFDHHSRLEVEDLSQMDYIHNWGMINYHTTHTPDNTIEKIAYDQLVRMNMLYNVYTIEPDFDAYNTYVNIANSYKGEVIPLNHLGDGIITLNNNSGKQ